MTEAERAQISESIAALMGLRFPPERWSDLERGINAAAGELGSPASALLERLAASQATRRDLQVLAGRLTVGETYFFRDPATFEILEREILPELISLHRHAGYLRIWSAGCATGEEAYSVAILLDRLLAGEDRKKITLLATDVNVNALRKASEGVYTEWSFRGVPAPVRDRYFTRTIDSRYAIRERIRRMVTFVYLNLAEDHYPSFTNQTNGIDLILCRNVLMYFCPDVARRVVANFSRALVEDGWLIVSPSEGSPLMSSAFQLCNRTTAILYRKSAGSSPVDGPMKQAEAGPPPMPPPERPGPVDLPAPPPAETADPVADAPEPDLRQRADGLYREGRYIDAETCLDGWLTAHPEDPEAMTLLARALANRGELRTALHWVEKSLRVNKLSPGRHYLRATILAELGAAGEAMAAMRRAVYLDHDFVLAHFGLAMLSRRRGRLRESRRHHQNVLGLLEGRSPGEVLPESEGTTVAALADMLRASVSEEAT